jgi:hypothetical protein
MTGLLKTATVATDEETGNAHSGNGLPHQNPKLFGIRLRFQI